MYILFPLKISLPQLPIIHPLPIKYHHLMISNNVALVLYNASATDPASEEKLEGIYGYTNPPFDLLIADGS